MALSPEFAAALSVVDTSVREARNAGKGEAKVFINTYCPEKVVREVIELLKDKGYSVKETPKELIIAW